MIIENKSKIKSENKSKILVLGLILIILTGFFSPREKVNAQRDIGQCTITVAGGIVAFKGVDMTDAECEGKKNINGSVGNKFWVKTGMRAETQEECFSREILIDGNAQRALEKCTPVGISTTTKTPSVYTLLAPLPCETGTPGCVTGQLKTFNPTQPNNLSAYLNLMIKIFIGLCAVLSVVMIVMGGVEYMTSELISSKEAGKEKIRNAILGLVLALGAYALLFTINPDLLKSNLDAPPTTVQVKIEGRGTCKYTEEYTVDSKTITQQIELVNVLSLEICNSIISKPPPNTKRTKVGPGWTINKF